MKNNKNVAQGDVSLAELKKNVELSEIIDNLEKENGAIIQVNLALSMRLERVNKMVDKLDLNISELNKIIYDQANKIDNLQSTLAESRAEILRTAANATIQGALNDSISQANHEAALHEIQELKSSLKTARDNSNMYKSAYENLIQRRTNNTSPSAEKFISDLKHKNAELMARNCQLASKQGDLAYEKRIAHLEIIVANLKSSLKHYDAEVDELGNLISKPCIWDRDRVLATMKNPNKQKGEELKIRLVHSQYGHYIDARIFKDGEPTKRGLCLAPSKMSKFAGLLSYGLEKAMDLITVEEEENANV
jgi:chromosome segregation ATPase